jgi:hypothetical protein
MLIPDLFLNITKVSYENKAGVKTTETNRSRLKHSTWSFQAKYVRKTNKINLKNKMCSNDAFLTILQWFLFIKLKVLKNIAGKWHVHKILTLILKKSYDVFLLLVNEWLI